MEVKFCLPSRVPCQRYTYWTVYTGEAKRAGRRFDGLKGQRNLARGFTPWVTPGYVPAPLQG